jgi:Cu(I)/Ag(I) efflux system membrane fusion protein
MKAWIMNRMSTRTVTVAATLGLGLSACGPGTGEAEPDMAATDEAVVTEDHSLHGIGGPTTRQAVHLTAAQERALGVRYATVSTMDLERTIRTVGRIEASEDRIADVTPKVDGFVEELFVSTTGEAVRAGAPLLTLYSPDLVAAQEELLTAMRLADRVDPSAEEAYEGAQAMLDAAERRLSFWDITREQVDRLKETRRVTRTLTLVSPVSGIVLEKPVNRGQRVNPGQLLYRVADLSEVWVEGDLFEHDLQLIREGSQAHIEVSAYPGEHRMGRVSFVYPTVDVGSRTNRVRVTLPNPGLALKPGMFATIFFDTRIGEGVVAVPIEAVVVTGERNLVFVRDADGMLQPREVVLGAQASDYVQILAGLDLGETIVQSANFLVDAESRLGSTGGSMPGMQHGSAIEPPGLAPAQDAGGHEGHVTEPDTSGSEHEGHDVPEAPSQDEQDGHDMPPGKHGGHDMPDDITRTDEHAGHGNREAAR